MQSTNDRGQTACDGLAPENHSNDGGNHLFGRFGSIGINPATGRLVELVDPNPEPCPHRWKCCDVYGQTRWFQPRKGVKIDIIDELGEPGRTSESALSPGDKIQFEGRELVLVRQFPVPSEIETATPVPNGATTEPIAQTACKCV